jgi:hypothetical protein
MTTPEFADVVNRIEDSSFFVCEASDCSRPLEISSSTGVAIHALPQGHEAELWAETHDRGWVERVFLLGQPVNTVAAAYIWAYIGHGRLLYPDDAETIRERGQDIISSLGEAEGGA